MKVGEIIENGEIQLLNYSHNDVSSNPRLHFTQLLQLLEFSVNMVLMECCLGFVGH